MSQSNDQIRTAVRDHYAKIAKTESSCCAPGCCTTSVPEASLALGYTKDDLSSVPDGANLGLGCGNPQAIAALKAGEVVLDLGSGAGFDCFLAARQVGEKGKVIGVDMTPNMISKARENAQKIKARNVEFRLGEIEHLPVADQSVDVILSNCVINLSPEKEAVFREAFRVLAPGGRLAISDVVALKELPAALVNDVNAISGCVSGAATIQEVTSLLQKAGFTKIQISVKEESKEFIKEWLPGNKLEEYIASANIEATKPREKHHD